MRINQKYFPKKSLFFLLTLIFTLGAVTFSKKHNVNQKEKRVMSMKLKITVKGKVFTATLYDNKTTKAFIKRLPMKVTMKDLPSNYEKYYQMQDSLPAETKPNQLPKVKSGELVLYSGSYIVLFYRTFSTSYRYIQMGQIEDDTNLESVLGRGDVVVSFEIIKEES